MLRNRILESYYNEIASDKDAAGYLNSQKKSYPKKFLFKVGKVINFSQLKYKIFFSYCLLYEKVWWLLYVYIVARFVLSNFIKPRRSDFLEKALNIGFTESKKTSYDFSLTGISPILEVWFTYRNLASYCTLKDKCSALSLAFSVIYGVQSSKKERTKLVFSSLKLHLNDVYKVAMYTVLIVKLKSCRINVLLNSHYERWTYLASQIAGEKLVLVQHGRLKEGITFAHKFGIINRLYCYNDKSYKAYLNYYSIIRDYQYIKPKLTFTHIGDSSKKNIFIASSIVAVDKEIAFIKGLLALSRKLINIVVYVKLHPLYDYAHQYDEVSDRVVFLDKNSYPYADYMVTYNSFLGDEYLALEQRVLFLEEYESIEEAVERVFKSLIEDQKAFC